MSKEPDLKEGLVGGPSQKTAEMETQLEKISKEIFGRSRADEDHCVTCGSDKVKHSDFRDELSRREFRISHSCQFCQDQTFGSPEEE